MNLSDILDLVTLVVLIAPVALNLVLLIGQMTSNVRMKTIAKRALIIVASLEDTHLLGEDRYTVAYDRLSNYAREVKIDLTPEQAQDHIEGALTMLRKGIDHTK